MPGVDDDRRTAVQIDAHELTGDELTVRRVGDHRFIGVHGLLREVQPPPASVAQTAHQQRCEEGGRDVVPGGIGDRNVQRVLVEVVVERVTPDGVGRFQPAGDGELSRLAGERSRQQAPLDLRGQRERGGSLTPLEQVGVPAVRNDDIGQRVRGCRYISDGLVIGALGEDQLKHTDGVPTIGHRHRQLGAAVDLLDVDLLGSQHLLVHRVRELQGLEVPAALPACRVLARLRPAEPDDGVAAEIGDQEADRAGPHDRGEFVGDDLDGLGRCGGLHALQQRPEVWTRTLGLRQHLVTIGPAVPAPLTASKACGAANRVQG